MPKAIYQGKAIEAPGEIERHFGYDFTARENGSLVADIPQDLIEGEIKAGRVVLLDDEENQGPANLDSMTVKELRDYAKLHAFPIPADVTAKADILAVLTAAQEPQE